MSIIERVPTAEVQFPESFRGVFERLKPRYLPLLVEARAELRRLEVPREVRPFYEYGVLEHAQPSFMLLPLMYLSVAEHAGGITERHRRYLPWYMLAMELAAVLDDTVDRTPHRSRRVTYHQRFGDASAAAFSAFLMSVVTARTAETAPEVLSLTTTFFEQLCALEVWELHSRYPKADLPMLVRWHELHTAEVKPGVAHSLNAALAIHGKPFLPREVWSPFGEIMQDVDDLVNFVERREDAGENDDLKLGIVTYPLIAAVRAEPTVSLSLDALWDAYRPTCSSPHCDLQARIRECAAGTATTYRAVSDAIARVGVQETIEKIRMDAASATRATPPELRECIDELVTTFFSRVAPFGTRRARSSEWPGRA